MVNSVYGIGSEVMDNNLKIVDNVDPTKKLQWEISGIASGTTVVMTAPTSDFNFNIPVFGETTVDKITIDNIVIDANDISSTSGNLTITPVAGSAVVIDGGASFDGTVLTGLTALTSTAITGTLQTAAQGNIDHDSLANFLSTEHFIQSAITIVGALTNITPGGDFTLTQNSVVPFTSVESGAVANTLYLKAGFVGVNTSDPSHIFTVEKAARTDIVCRATTDDMAVFMAFGNNETTNIRMVAGKSTAAGSIRANTTALQTISNVDMDFHTNNISRMTIKANGDVGIGTTVPGAKLDVNAGSGNMIADGYDNHPSFFERKVNPVIMSSAGYADKVKNTPVYKFKKNPFVSADELKELTITEFGQTKWDEIFPTEDSHRQKALYNMVAGEMKTFIDSEADRLRIERSTEHKNKREYCSIVLDDAGTESNFQEVLIKDEANVVTGFNIESYIGVLHLAIQELTSRVKTLEAA